MNRASPEPLTTEEKGTDSRPDIQLLLQLAARGLVPMFDKQRQLFCYRLVRGNQGLIREGVSPRYTIMTLLGLRALERSRANCPFDTESLYKSFAADTNWIQCAGDLGLFIWLRSEFAPETIDEVDKRFDLKKALDFYSDARGGRTMELAWLLTGLVSAASSSPNFANAFSDVTLRTYRLLRENQGRHGLFGHINERKSLIGRLRGRIGSFADQIYPIYALSKFSDAFHSDEALESALQCAKAICSRQGQMGQWWWLYDSDTGAVASRYPVYSVHQHGMAPMGLFAIEEASGQSFQEPVYKGLRWVYGINELGLDMRDCEQNLIWRSMLPKSSHVKYWNVASSIFGGSKRDTRVGPLQILHEDRPYELGWLLFAFARTSTLSTRV